MGDAEKLFEALVRENADMLMVYLRAAVGESAEVEDLFQETMIIAWRRLDDFDQTRPFGAWLRGIARNLVMAHHRQRSRQQWTTTVWEQLECRLSEIGQQEGETWREKLRVLQACVSALPERYREVVTLRYYQQQAVAQVCEAMSISLAAAKKRLQRARTMVLKCMKSRLAASEIK
jgi:RNA polymerase sigma-70 factor (ECF subfamily)